MLKILAKLIHFITFIASLLLALRIVLSILHVANTKEPFLKWFFYTTDLIVHPFINFASHYWYFLGIQLDAWAVIAFVVYTVIGFIVLEIVRLL